MAIINQSSMTAIQKDITMLPIPLIVDISIGVFIFTSLLILILGNRFRDAMKLSLVASVLVAAFGLGLNELSYFLSH